MRIVALDSAVAVDAVVSAVAASAAAAPVVVAPVVVASDFVVPQLDLMHFVAGAVSIFRQRVRQSNEHSQDYGSLRLGLVSTHRSR